MFWLYLLAAATVLAIVLRRTQRKMKPLLKGTVTFNAPGMRSDGSPLWLNVRMVAVHDHHMRFVGQHCLVENRTRLCDLEEQLRELSVSALPR